MYSNLVFVGGPPRSGTTLLQNILDSHPAILGVPEFKHLPQIVQLRNDMLSNVESGMIDVFFSKDKVEKEIKGLLQRLLLNALDNPNLNRDQADILAEKTPGNVLVFRELAVMYPQARFILMLRDPRGIVNSLRSVKARAEKRGDKVPHFASSLAGAIGHTREHLESGLAFEAEYPDRVLTVFYEDLILYTQAETQRLCEFLRVKWSEEMLHPGQHQHLGEGTMTAATNSKFYDKRMFNRDPEKASIRKWEQQLPLKSQRIVANEFQAYPLLNDKFALDQQRGGWQTAAGSLFYFTGQNFRGHLHSFKRRLSKIVYSYG